MQNRAPSPEIEGRTLRRDVRSASRRGRDVWGVRVISTLLLSLVALLLPSWGDVRADTATPMQYGVTSLDLDDFTQYKLRKMTPPDYGSDYYIYGAGMRLTWLLPPEVQAGDHFRLWLPPDVWVDSYPLYDAPHDGPIPGSMDPFFIIYERGHEGEADHALLNVYFEYRETETGDVGALHSRDVLRFQATPYAQELAGGTRVMQGTATIGREISNGDILSVQTPTQGYDAATRAQDACSSHRPSADTRYYLGFRPNRAVFNSQTSESRDSSRTERLANSYTVWKTLRYRAQYKDDAVYEIADRTGVSYYQEMKCEVTDYVKFGDLSLQAERQTRDTVTYGVVYRANGGDVSADFRLSTYGFPLDGGYIPQKSDPSQPLVTSLKRASTAFLDADARLWAFCPTDRVVAPERTEIPVSDLREKVLTPFASNFSFPESYSGLAKCPGRAAFYLRLTLKKNKTITTPSGDPGWFFGLRSSRKVRTLLIEDFYHSTSGTGTGVVVQDPRGVVSKPVLRIKKVDENGAPLGRSGVAFRLKDLVTDRTVDYDVGPDGYVPMYGILFPGHEYELTEISGADGFVRDVNIYRLKVMGMGEENIQIYRRVDGTDRPLGTDSLLRRSGVNGEFLDYVWTNVSEAVSFTRFAVTKVDDTGEPVMLNGTDAHRLKFHLADVTADVRVPASDTDGTVLDVNFDSGGRAVFGTGAPGNPQLQMGHTYEFWETLDPTVGFPKTYGYSIDATRYIVVVAPTGSNGAAEFVVKKRDGDAIVDLANDERLRKSSDFHTESPDTYNFILENPRSGLLGGVSIKHFYYDLLDSFNQNNGGDGSVLDARGYRADAVVDLDSQWCTLRVNGSSNEVRTRVAHCGSPDETYPATQETVTRGGKSYRLVALSTPEARTVQGTVPGVMQNDTHTGTLAGHFVANTYMLVRYYYVLIDKPTEPIYFRKLGSGAQEGASYTEHGYLEGAEFRIYPANPDCDTHEEREADPSCPLFNSDGAVENLVETQPGDMPGGAQWKFAEAQFGQTYVLVETKSPSGFQLLPHPVIFTIGADGVPVVESSSATVMTLSKEADPSVPEGTRSFIFSIIDPHIGPLPKAGGAGIWWIVLIGLLVVFGGVWRSGRGRR